MVQPSKIRVSSCFATQIITQGGIHERDQDSVEPCHLPSKSCSAHEYCDEMLAGKGNCKRSLLNPYLKKASPR